ncbi:MerR family transcriptional regulator [Actinoplanes couchii]|uniref:MerR family transcriptional regulator n=1 Tax=Actinoplanes couchii TaxID=403638 RepID=A0ABQ3X6N1_9ACTN|nr:MerR family transcriptional regulator [Actinoplanes couchii]MDR6322007.1 DNA-binding transcriptional MerR regulator [Actinoplanes couchii]GID54171.1 MerR family transcriptional regulator [Actinoplanes couchii]
MNSAEVARLAGVSVRTLRHYHQIKILPEPVRRSNGYREYTVHDLILLLRVRRLTELGLALDEIPPLLESPERAAAVLDELDRELAGQIELLTARRAMIARLRATGASPDTPVELAGLVEAAGRDLPADLARQDRDLMMLLHHGLDDRGREMLSALLERVVDPALLAGTTELTMRFAALGPDSTEDEIERLAGDYRAMLGTFDDEQFENVDIRTGELLTAYQQSVFNDAQRAFLERLGETAV